MKPITELQRRVVALSKTLPLITEAQMNWAFDKCFERHFVQSRKTIYCLECGHTRKDEPQPKNTIVFCKNCGNSLKELEEYRSFHKENVYCSIIDTAGGLQVVRMFFLIQYCKRGKTAKYSAHEVMQHWIDPSGNVATMALNVQGLSYYIDQWIFNGELKLMPANYKLSARFGIGPFKILPNRKVLPIIKRNGFKGYFYGLTPQALFYTILGDSAAETLLKSGQIELLRSYSTRRSFQNGFMDYWPSIKICLRNGYIIKDPSLWFDHVSILKHFGKDIHSAKYVCPNDLIAEHGRLLTKKRAQDKKEALEAQRKNIEEAQLRYAEEKRMFMDLLFRDGELVIKPLATVEDFMNEGDELHHCVFSSKYYNKPESLILSARINDMPIETIEVSLEKLEVVQARGRGNQSTKFHNRILSLVNGNINQISDRKLKTA